MKTRKEKEYYDLHESEIDIKINHPIGDDEMLDHPEDLSNQAEWWAKEKIKELLKDIELRQGDRMILVHSLQHLLSDLKYEILTKGR